MKIKFILSIILINTLIINQLSSQDVSGLDELSQRFQNNYSYQSQEEVWVHNDKPYYFTGETIWFKVYCMDATFHVPSTLSKVAYVELVSDENQPVFQEKIVLEEGSGNGYFFINTKIGTGKYKIKAYTSLMKNLDPGYLFEKEISIISPFKPNFENPPEPSELTIALFPEGGDLVTGLESRVAIQVLDNLGNGIEAEGYLVNQEGNREGLVQTSARGIGTFNFTPKRGQSYKVIFNDGQRSYEQEMPEALNSGMVLNLNHQYINQRYSLNVVSNSGSNEEFVVFIHSSGITEVKEKRRLSEGKAVLEFSEDKLTSGVHHITLFNNKMEPVAERLFFIHPDQTNQLQVTTDKRTYDNRERVKIDLENLVKNTEKSADLSLTVYKKQASFEYNSNNPWADLLLQSDLRGNIQDVNYYFDNTSSDRKKELDELIMTHGWRKFDWSKVLETEPAEPQFLAEIKSPLVSGYFPDGDSLQGKDLIAFIAGKSPQLYVFTVDKNNRFSFEVSPLVKSGDLLFWNQDKNLSDFKMELDNSFIPYQPLEQQKFINVDRELLDFIQEYSVNIQITNAYALENNSRGSLSTEMEIENAFFGSPDVVYYLDDYTRFPSLDEVFIEYVRYAAARKKNGVESLFVKDFEYKSVGYDFPALTLMDGVPISDINFIWEFDQTKVEKIEIVSRMVNSGSQRFHGVVNISSFKGNLGGNTVPDDIIQKLYKGIQVPRTFYSPEHASASIDRIPDYRSTLLWEPDLIMDTNGKESLEFFTSDFAGEYRIEVFGISENGIILFETKDFNVKSQNNKQ